MRLLNIFKRKKNNIPNLHRIINYKKLNNLIEEALMFYNERSCQCCFPRFIQIVSIDCLDYGKCFSSYETEVLIYKSRKYFKIEKKQECEKWMCKKCNSEYILVWQDFSIHVDRTVLKPIKILSTVIGKEAKAPIPLYRGLSGHSFPSKTEIKNVTFKEFTKYLLEY